MTQTTACPDIVELERFVLKELDDATSAMVSGHVADCAQCANDVADMSENLQMASALKRSGRSSTVLADDTADHSAADPTTVGPYRILRKLGQGGMGSVYEAEQDNPRRVVALKMIRAGLMSARLMARFRHEAQVLGRLRHPGIAQIYEAGTHTAPDRSRQPYFAMELVHGPPLLKFAESKRLNSSARLALLAKVCDAVQHAHSKGVIHRDLKPDNILVEDSGIGADHGEAQPKILDFGVARVIDPDGQTTTLHTSVGQIVGTVAYMSPEQAAADPAEIDTRSDVYALGVICFQLLCGKLPYTLNLASVAESVRAIVQDEPKPLSTMDRSLRGDVTTIVGKALEKDRTRRYPSAAEMAADIRRHLRDEPISAHPPSTIYQVRKFARRNKALVGGVIAAFVLLAAGIVGVSIQWRRAEQSAVIARSEVAKQAAVNSFLQDMLGAANPRNLTADDRAKGRNVSVLDALNVASRKVDAGSLKDHPDVELAVRKSMAVAYSELAETDSAERHFLAALDLSKRLYGQRNTDAADALNSLAIMRKTQARLPEAEVFVREAMSMSLAVDGEAHPNFATCNDSMGSILQAQGKYAEAEPFFRKGLELRRRIYGDEAREVSTSMNNLAYVLADQGKEDEAEPLYRQSFAIRSKILGDHPDTATVLNNLAFIVRGKGQLAEAETLFREALRMRRKTLGEGHPATGTGLNNLASVLQAQGKLAEAEPLYIAALENSRKFHGPDHPTVAQVLNNLGSVRMVDGKPADAEPYFRESLAIRRKTLPAAHPGIGNALRNLASALLDTNRADEAEPLIVEALAMSTKAGEVKLDTAAARALLGSCRLQQKRYSEAEPELLAALEVMAPRISANDPRGTLVAQNLVKLYTATNQPERAAKYQALLATSRPVSQPRATESTTR